MSRNKYITTQLMVLVFEKNTIHVGIALLHFILRLLNKEWV